MPPTPARHTLPWRAVALGLLLLVSGALAPATAAAARWRRRRHARDDRARAEAAWADLREGAQDLGLPVSPSHTPRQVAAQLALVAHLDSGAGFALDRITQVVERSRYAESMAVAAQRDMGAADMGAAGRLDTDVDAVLRALAASRRPVVRLRARVLPRSGLAVLSRLSERTGRRLGALDQGWGARLRRATAPR